MFRKFIHYVAALTFLSILALVYHIVVVNFLEPPDIPRVARAVRGELRGEDNLGDLFPDGAWQRGACKRLQTADGMLLFENWQQSSESQWKLWPITVVIGRGIEGSTTDSPIILESPEGAEIKFAGSLDVMSGGAPPIQRGRMIGSVEIRRESSKLASSDRHNKSLRIQTANVGIDNQKIWTTEAIRMSLGTVQLVGRDLTIHLSSAAASQLGDHRQEYESVSATHPPVRPGQSALLDRMELIYLDELIMPLENGGLWPPSKTASASSAILGRSAATLRVQCGGRLDYDFAIDQLVLRDSVSLIHQIEGAPTDRFDCDTIELTFNHPSDRSVRRNSPLDWITRLKATGTPLVASLPNLDVQVAAGQIDLQADRGLIRADGTQGIEIHRAGIHARLENFVYQYDPASPEMLGAMDARGIGIVTIENPDLPLQHARWRDGFKLQPLDRISKSSMLGKVGFWIDGAIEATLADGGSFAADSIEGLLKSENDPTSGNNEPMLVPEQLVASRNVKLDTSAIAAETDELRLFFEHQRYATPKMVDEGDPQKTNSIRRLVMQPEGTSDPTHPIARSRPAIEGDTIRAELEFDSSGVIARDLSVIGDVRLSHTVQLGGQPMEALLTGQQLRLIDGGGEDVLQLGSGIDAPARFQLGDGHFIGPLIQIRPSDNIVWIKQAGEFQIPSQALPKNLAGATDSGASGSSVTWTAPPRCRWNGEMVFDGQKAVMTDGIKINASVVNGTEPWDLEIDGDRMEIVLQEGVQVRNLQTVRNAVVQRIDLLQSELRPIQVVAVQRAGDGLTESKHLLHSEKLSLLPEGGGRIYGEGPGWYRNWTRGNIAKLPNAGNTQTASVDPIDRTLMGMHLTFHNSLQGDLLRKSLAFTGGIRLGVREVGSWDDEFNAATMDSLSRGQSTLDCDQLQFAIAPSRRNSVQSDVSLNGDTPWETQVTGGVVFRTRGEHGFFECSASRAAYASGKDLFTLHGSANQPALFRRAQSETAPAMEGAVRTMAVRLKTMEVENLQLERLSSAPPPGLGQR